MRVILGSLFALGLCFAQSKTPSFEVASVKPAAPPSEAERNGARQTSDSKAYEEVTLLRVCKSRYWKRRAAFPKVKAWPSTSSSMSPWPRSCRPCGQKSTFACAVNVAM